MNRFALMTFYRSLTRHRLYAALNIGGLAVGIAVFLVLGLYVRSETSYEKWNPEHREIYVVQDEWKDLGIFTAPSQSTMGGLLEQMKGDFPGLVGTRIITPPATILRDGVGVDENLALVDPDFLRLFRLPVVRGDASRALDDPANLLIEERIAAKYFPGTDPIGKPITIVVAGHPHIYRVAAVLKDLPGATDLKLGMIAKLVPAALDMDNWYHWGSEQLATFLRFDTPAAARAFAGKLDAFVARHGIKDFGKKPLDVLHESLLPIDDVHLTTPGARLTVTTLGIVGLLTLLIAIINYVNLAIARAGLRAREVAMRKVLGASRVLLVRHFLGEAVATVAIAALIGLALAELGLPLVNAAGGLTLTMPYAVVAPALVLLTAAIGIMAGFYPAVLLSAFPAAAVLASARAPGGGRSGARVREGLVVMQFALATAFMIGTMILFAQTTHVRNTDLGYGRDGLIVVPALRQPALSETQRTTLLATFAALPDVRGVTMANMAPGDNSNRNSNNLELPGVPGEGPSLQQFSIGPDFFRVMSARLLAGRLFDAAHRADDGVGMKLEDPRNIVITRMAVPALHFRSLQDAIGRTVGKKHPRTIVGVVDDMRFYSPREPLGPAYFSYRSRDVGDPIAIVRTTDTKATLDAIRAAWRRIAPEVPFEARTATQNLAQYYEADDHAARLFTIGATLAVLIGCVGLWGLASFNTARRVKEIGIRKTLGASSADIVRLLVGQFLRPVLIANLFAWPLAWAAMRTWLAGFDDRIALSPLFFVAASVTALAIALATVLAQSLRAARATPAWALRHD